jgi:hypothetical protein
MAAGDRDGAARRRVVEELTHRGWSARRLASEATAAGATITDPPIGAYINGGKLTPKVRLAITKAFKWDQDWPENPPKPLSLEARADVLDEILRIVRENQKTLDELLRYAATFGGLAAAGQQAPAGRPPDDDPTPLSIPDPGVE